MATLRRRKSAAQACSSSAAWRRVDGRRLGRAAVSARLAWFPPAATSNRACDSPAHGSPTFFTVGIRLPPPRPMWTWGDDDSIEIDQPEAVGRLEGENRPAVLPAARVTLGHEQSQALGRVGADRVEVTG